MAGSSRHSETRASSSLHPLLQADWLFRGSWLTSYACFKMIAKLQILQFICIGISSLAAGELRLMCPTQQVRATEGESVTLPCHLDQRIDLSEDTVEWTKLYPEETVHVYRRRKDDPGPQSPQYKDRTTLNREDLKTGNLALNISSVNQSDSGTYRCVIPEEAEPCTVDLLIDVQQILHRAHGTMPPPAEETRSQLDETNTTTSPPAEGRRNHWAAIAVIIFIAVLLLLVLLVWNRAKIRDRVKRVCRRKKPEAETDGSASEMKKLNRAAEGDEDHDRQEEHGDVV